MLSGKPIPDCPFVPFVIPSPKTADYRLIQKMLDGEKIKRSLIFLAKDSFEDPPYVDYLDIRILRFSQIGKYERRTYLSFFDVAYEIIGNSEELLPKIGIASRSSPDLVGYFIVLYLFNELGYDMDASLSIFNDSLSPGITKPAYLRRLERLSGRFYYQKDFNQIISPKPPKQQKQTELEANSNSNVISESGFDVLDNNNYQNSIQQNNYIANPITNSVNDALPVNPEFQQTQQLPIPPPFHQLPYQQPYNNQYPNAYPYLNQEQYTRYHYEQYENPYLPNPYKYDISSSSSYQQRSFTSEFQEDANPDMENLQSFFGKDRQKEQLLPIEKEILGQQKQQLTLEVIRATKYINLNSLFSQSNPICHSTIEKLACDVENIYCVTPEPEGKKALMYIKSNLIYLFDEDLKIIQLNIPLRVPNNCIQNDIYLLEVKYIRSPSPTIVLCDIYHYQMEKLRDKPFDLRMGYVKELYSNFLKSLDHKVCKFFVRPLLRLTDYKIIIKSLISSDDEEKQTLCRYPISGISLVPLKTPSSQLFLNTFIWKKNIDDLPKVLVYTDLAQKMVYGNAVNRGTTALVAHFGELTPSLYELNGETVEIEVLDQDPDKMELLNAKVLRLSDDRPWNVSKFLKWYPERKPQPTIDQINQMLEKLAQQAQYHINKI
ncbi:hypothetical protein TRFO_36643 [Tritrichomonas foetus]|uniref:Uncharacterized protein n=1 Tax=Tritrichomonas foetus TaxID=1144522 RepID=A0A1J4JEU0_9EUKA|nr:hypothetical protein TRFO_36643 [Tritrichomonas foetus]|eukprot:OHS97185.1 hypothetical protein TRFO_36643 [Tritrichomonas foetus]